MRKRRIRYDRIVILTFVLILLGFGIYMVLFNDSNKKVYMSNFIGKNVKEINKFASNNKLKVEIEYDYSDTYNKDLVVEQSIKKGQELKENSSLKILVSLGKLDLAKLKSDSINELGKIPVMMYHGIVDTPSNDTKYTGGNVDKDGYNRTAEAFRKDLEFYYQEGYQMIRLIDYINGNISTSYGKSPIVLTFDDGNDNNIKVTGLDSQGDIIIDPNSAVGILEEFKKKYPDYLVTATFFVNETLFQQKEYDEKILKWLVNNNYDIGNHTKGHVNFKNITQEQTVESIGSIYEKLESIIPSKYQFIIALPFGSPYNQNHENFPYILKGTYNNLEYNNVAALRVGWEADYSPYSKLFDPTFIKRCRAYDNNGEDFDIEMNFKILKTKRYISDGNRDTIVISSENKDDIIETNKKVILY